MLDIIDHQILEHLEREKSQKRFWERASFLIKKYWNKASDVRLLIGMAIFACILVSQVVFPSCLGVQTLYGASLEMSRSSDSMNTVIADKSKALTGLSVSIESMHQLTLPVSLQKMLDAKNAEIPFSNNISTLYNIIEELFPHNFADREVILNRIFFDSGQLNMVVDGQVQNKVQELSSDKNDSTDGYALIGKLVSAANASPYFQKAVLQEARIDENNKNILVYRILFPFQSAQDRDDDDSVRNIIEQNSKEPEMNRVKRK